MEMLELVWPALVALAIYAILGWSLARLIGLRGLWAIAVAPAFATTVIGVASTVAGWVGLGWSILPAIATAAVIAVGIVVAGRLTRSRVDERPSPGTGWWTLGTAVFAGAAIALLFARVVGAPDAISQTFDNMFHLNAIRYVVDTGVASPLELGQMTSPSGGIPFYPSAWHATIGLIVQLTGVAIPVALNAMTFVTAAVVWPLGALLLARVLSGTSAAVTVGAGIVAASVPAFPILPMDYGVLYPYQLSLALLPAVLAATARLLRVGRETGDSAPGWWALTVVGALPGVALAHPGGFVGWLALTVPMVVVFGIRLWRVWTTWRRRVLIVAAAVAYVVIGVLLLRALRPPLETRGWPIATDLLDASWKALSVSVYYPAAAWAVGLAILAGLYWSIRERSLVASIPVAVWFVGAALFIVVIALPWQTLRDALTGSWYNNWPRLAALFVVTLVPLAALGIGRTADAVVAVLRRRRVPRGARVAIGVVASFLALIAFSLQATPKAAEWAGNTYRLDDSSALLTADELALLDRLDDLVPEDAVIAGNAYTGAGLAYAIADRAVLMPHALMDISDDLQILNEHLRDGDAHPGVCAALDALDVDFVLDFGYDEVHGGDLHPLAGVQELQDSQAVRLVDSEGDARLYEVVACGRG